MDKTCRDVYNRSLLHDAFTSSHANKDSIGPSKLLRWARRQYERKGTVICTEGTNDDALYMLYRGRIDVLEGVVHEAHTIYPGALFNEHVLYSPPGTGALYTAGT